MGCGHMLEQPAPDVLSYSAPGDLTQLRAFVRARALAFGLSSTRAEMLQLAVSELATNTLLHTTGGGRVRVWAEPDHVVCDVVDSGPLRGFDASMPPADAIGGRGLPIVERVCDDVRSTTVADGTLVQLRLLR